VEVTAYYIVSEALTNAAKRANATAVHDPARGSGLLGLHDRVEAADGTITIHSPIGGGTELLVELPLRPVPVPD